MLDLALLKLLPPAAFLQEGFGEGRTILEDAESLSERVCQRRNQRQDSAFIDEYDLRAGWRRYFLRSTDGMVTPPFGVIL
jgi:hypothetical protein